jgi:hypothetical protein
LKPADILLTATLSFKLTAKASTTIRSVAFLLCDLADEMLASTITNAIIDKMIDKLSEPLGALNNSVTAAKGFLDATAQKHTSELLELQNSVQSQADLAKSLTETVE